MRSSPREASCGLPLLLLIALTTSLSSASDVSVKRFEDGTVEMKTPQVRATLPPERNGFSLALLEDGEETGLAPLEVRFLELEERPPLSPSSSIERGIGSLLDPIGDLGEAVLKIRSALNMTDQISTMGVNKEDMPFYIPAGMLHSEALSFLQSTPLTLSASRLGGGTFAMLSQVFNETAVLSMDPTDSDAFLQVEENCFKFAFGVHGSAFESSNNSFHVVMEWEVPPQMEWRVRGDPMHVEAIVFAYNHHSWILRLMQTYKHDGETLSVPYIVLQEVGDESGVSFRLRFVFDVFENHIFYDPTLGAIFAEDDDDDDDDDDDNEDIAYIVVPITMVLCLATIIAVLLYVYLRNRQLYRKGRPLKRAVSF
ncbi:hypothetical protein QOT17_006710 [Balamuthia mandrillaris]